MLKEGKTNLKYILIVVVLGFVVSVGILRWVVKQEIPLAELPEIEKSEKKDETADECSIDSDCQFYCGCGCVPKDTPDCPKPDIFCEEDPCNSCRCLNGKCFSWTEVFIDAQQKKDISLCQEIRNEDCKKQCLEVVTSLIKDEAVKEQACIDSGGKVSTSVCCKSVGDFPNLCLIDTYGCSQINSHQVKICDCGINKCFNGEECTALNWKTYIKDNYAFDFEPPEGFNVTSVPPPYFSLRGFLHITIDPQKYLLNKAAATGYLSFKKDNMESSECNSAFLGKYSGFDSSELAKFGLSEQKQIDNIIFYRNVFGDTDMQASYSHVQYRTFHNEGCYKITLLIRSSSAPYKTCTEECEKLLEQLREAGKLSDEEVLKALNQMLSTFRFLE